MTRHESSCIPKTSKCLLRRSSCQLRILSQATVCLLAVESSQIARAEVSQALHRAITAAADAHQRGAVVVVGRLAGVAVLVLAVAHQDGAEVVAAPLAGEGMADAQLTVVVMEVAPPTVGQQHTAGQLRTEVQHPMVAVQHMAVTMATAPRTEASILVVVHLVGVDLDLDLATQPPSQAYPHLHPELTMRHQRLVAMVPTLHLHLADPWMLPRLATTLRLHRETAMVSHRQLHQHQVRGISRHQRPVERTLATIEHHRNCMTRSFVYLELSANEWKGDMIRCSLSQATFGFLVEFALLEFQNEMSIE